jgi:ABC-type multidrug transport system permease subunit
LLSVIWVSMAIASIGIAVSGMAPAFWIPLLIALLTTFAFVGLPSLRQNREKAKHRPQDRVALLLELLSDE